MLLPNVLDAIALPVTELPLDSCSDVSGSVTMSDFQSTFDWDCLVLR